MEFSLDSAVAVLSRTPASLHAALAGLPDEWVHAREAPDAWSPYQVCGHLLHIEQSDWIDRTQVILEHGTDQVFEPVDREAGFVRFAGWSLDDVLAGFTTARLDNLEALSRLVGADDLDRRGVHPTFGEVSLGQLLATWVVHDLNHTHQIVKTMAKEYAEAVGPWRAFLPVVDVP